MTAPDEAAAPIKCPHCGGDVHVGFVSRLMDESRMSFEMMPAAGELFSARNMGGAIVAMDKLLTEIGKDLGVKTVVGVSGLTFNEGSIKVDLVLSRHEPGVRRRKP